MNNYLFTDISNLNHIILAMYVLLIVYIVFIIPHLNTETIELFKRLEVKLMSLFIIIYISISNPILAILLSLSLILTLQELNKKTLGGVVEDTLEDVVVQEEAKNNVVQSNELNDFMNNSIKNQKQLLKNDIIGNFSLDSTSDSQKLINNNLNNKIIENVPAHPSLNNLDRELPETEVKTFKNQMGTQGLDNEITGYLSNSGIYGEASVF